MSYFDHVQNCNFIVKPKTRNLNSSKFCFSKIAPTKELDIINQNMKLNRFKNLSGYLHSSVCRGIISPVFELVNYHQWLRTLKLVTFCYSVYDPLFRFSLFEIYVIFLNLYNSYHILLFQHF